MGRSVQDGEVKTTSATQIKTFQGCNLAWYFDKVEGRPRKQSASQALGEAIHTECENYLEHGTPPTQPSVRMAINAGLVPRYDPVKVERGLYVVEQPRNYITGLKLAGVPVLGRIDLRLAPTDGIFTVRDWKSASSFNYCMTPEQLARDVQGLLYLEYGFTLYPEAEAGIFDHVYLKTKGGAGVQHRATDPLTRAYVSGMWFNTIEPVVEKMKAVAKCEKPTDVEYNLRSCDAYGGCAYRDFCPAVNKSSVSELMFAAEMDKGKEEEEMLDIMAQLKARKEALAAKAEPKKDLPVATGINPPDAAKPVEEEKKVEAPLPTLLTATVAPPPAPVVPPEAEKDPLEGLPTVVTGIPPPPPPPPAEKKPRATRKKVELAPALSEVPEEPEPVVVAPGIVEAVKKLEEAIEKAIENPKRVVSEAPLFLFIDATIEKGFDDIMGGFTSLTQEIERRTGPCIEAIRKVEPSAVPQKCVDVRQVAFGRGKTELVASFKTHPPKGIVMATNAGLSAEVLEVLIPQAQVVVRG